MEATDATDVEQFQQLARQVEWTGDVVSEDPLRVRATIRHDGAGTLSALFNEDVEIVEIEREA